MVNQTTLVSPWGNWLLEDDGEYILTLDYWRSAKTSSAPSKLGQQAQQQLDAYFNQASFQFELPLKPEGTDFQRRVWHYLQAIPVGQAHSYGDAAKALNTAARAIGGACRANPIPLFIPCHRIVAKQGLGGFSGHTSGERIDFKHQLLRHEGAC